MRKLVVLLVVFLSIVNSVPQTQAQDGGNLDEIDLLLLERLYTVLTTPQAYTAYVETFSGQDVQEFRYVASGQSTQILSGSITERETTLVRRNDLFSSLSILTFEYQENDGEATNGYALAAEVRAIDSDIFIKGEYTTTAGDVPEAPPTTWIKIDSESPIAAYNRLNLSSYLTDAYPIQDIEILKASLDAIGSETVDLGNGIGAEKITAKFTGDGFIAMFKALQPQNASANQDNPLFDAIFSMLDETSRIQISATVRTDNTPIEIGLDISLTTGQLRLNDIFPERFDETQFLFVRLRVLNSRRFSQINDESLTSIEAPVLP